MAKYINCPYCHSRVKKAKHCSQCGKNMYLALRTKKAIKGKKLKGTKKKVLVNVRPHKRHVIKRVK